MACHGQLTRMHLAVVVVVLLGVGLGRAQVFFDGGAGKADLLLEESPDLDGGDVGGELVGKPGRLEHYGWADGEQALRQEPAFESHRAVGDVTALKRSWLPGTQTGLFGKRGVHWLLRGPAADKRWGPAVAQGRFGQPALARWTVKRSTAPGDGSNFDRQRKGGVPHVFKTGGLFGKRSAGMWEDKLE